MSASLQDCLRAHELLLAIYGRRGGSVGCCWHVVLDDANVEDDFVQDGVHVDRTHLDCVEMGGLLRKMTMTQRRKLAEGKYDEGGYAPAYAEARKQGWK